MNMSKTPEHSSIIVWILIMIWGLVLVLGLDPGLD